MVIDIILVILIIIAALWGAHKGGVKIIASIASFVIAFVLAYFLASTVGEYIKTSLIINKDVFVGIISNKSMCVMLPAKYDAISNKVIKTKTKANPPSDGIKYSPTPAGNSFINELKTLAQLPSREELIAKLAGCLLANVSKLAATLDAVRVKKEAENA